MSVVKTPFSDAVGPDSVPTRSSSGGKYDSEETPGTPGRDGGYFPELHRDGAVTGSPSKSGPATSIFKDAVTK